jgi:hypothetical protein
MLVAWLKLGWKDLPGTNALAYLSSLSVMKKKSFPALTTDDGGKAKNFFFAYSHSFIF